MCPVRQNLLREIMEIDFFLDDLALYLDTHPNDRRALLIFNDYVNRVYAMKQNYERVYGPLISSRETNGIEWKWIENISIVYIIEEYKNIILDELKYSLRSIDKYLPWFKGTIFIIIEDKSFCSSLKQNNEHLVFIHPIDIISKKFRPSYNREIIELFLDKIPDITERFIYLNKYHYFERMTHPRLFFNNDFFPKYNLGTSFEEKPKKIKNSNSISFFETYELIQNIFGKNYVNYYRYLIEGPIPLYRDLFKPVRKLYLQDIISKKAASNGNFNILPIYLVMTYNIYGTDQIYYPEYVAGFGKIRNSPLPKLNKNRNITYYGFDITSKAILEKTNKNIIFKSTIKNFL